MNAFDFREHVPGARLAKSIAEVRDLPRFDMWQDADETVERINEHCRLPGATRTLRPIQCLALATFYETGGLHAPLRTGAGKSLVSLLLATMRPEFSAVPLLILPAARIEPTRDIIADWSRDVRIFPHILTSYEALSHPRHADDVDKWKPTLIVADEADCLKDSGGTRWDRIRTYLTSHPDVPFVPMSGSFEARNLMEYWHLIRRSLGDRAPVPKDPMLAKTWAAMLGSKRAAGLDPEPLLAIGPGEPDDGKSELDQARSRFGRRLVQTLGVVSSGSDVPPIPLTCREVPLPPSESMLDIARYIENELALPGGLPFVPEAEGLEVWRHLREVAAGFHYEPVVPPPAEWAAARRTWFRFCRDIFKRRFAKLTTPGTIARAIREPLAFPQLTRYALAEVQAGRGYLDAWEAIRPTHEPELRSVWHCDSTVEYAADWLRRTNGICWVEHDHAGRAIAARAGVPFFQARACDATGKHIEKHNGACVASARSCARGHNLQHMQQNLVITPMTRNAQAEQQISRTHRDGQKKPVHVDFLLRLPVCRASLEQTLEDANMVARTQQAPQRLTVAQWR